MWIFWKGLNKTGSASSEYQESGKKILDLNRLLQPFLTISVTLSAEGWKMNSDMEIAFLEVGMYFLVWEEISFDSTEL